MVGRGAQTVKAALGNARLSEARACAVLGETITSSYDILPGLPNAFRADGALDPATMQRLARIIEAVDALRMVVNVGFLYQSRPAALPSLAQGVGLDELTNQSAEWPADVFWDAAAL